MKKPELEYNSKNRLSELLDQEIQIAAQHVKDKYFNPFVLNIDTKLHKCIICDTNFKSLANSHSEIVLEGAKKDKTKKDKTMCQSADKFG